jgi:hypothetical protein
MCVRRFIRWYFVIPLGLAALAAFIVVGGWIVMMLWNWLLPTLFGWPQITIWQGFGLLALCRILFGGFGSHGRGHGPSRHMTPEERERFRQRMRDRFFGRSGESQPPPREV